MERIIAIIIDEVWKELVVRVFRFILNLWPEFMITLRDSQDFFLTLAFLARGDLPIRRRLCLLL